MSQSNSTTTADDGDQPSATLQDDVSLRKETSKPPLDSTCHIHTTDTVDGPYGAHEATLSPSTCNQRIGGSEGGIPTSSIDQTEQRKGTDQVSGLTDSPCAQCNNGNTVVSGLGPTFEDVSTDGFECSTVGSSTEQPAITQSLSAQTNEALFEDITMDGEVGQDATAGGTGQDVDVGPLKDSSGLKMGKSNVLQTCFTGVLNPEGGGNFRELCDQSSTPQESKSCSEAGRGLNADCSQSSNTTQEKSFQNENSHSSGNQSTLNRSKRKRHRRDETMEHSGLECAAAKQAKSDKLVTCLRLQGVNEDSSAKDVAEELVRCLHEVRVPMHLLVFRAFSERYSRSGPHSHPHPWNVILHVCGKVASLVTQVSNYSNTQEILYPTANLLLQPTFPAHLC